MKNILKFVPLLLPVFAFAAPASVGDIDSAIGAVGKLINSIIPLIFAIATVYFIWNLVKYIEAGKGDEKARGEAKDSIVFSLVLMFVMLSVWGLVGILKGSVTFTGEVTETDFPTPWKGATE